MVEAAEGDLAGDKRAPRGQIRASVPMSGSSTPARP